MGIVSRVGLGQCRNGTGRESEREGGIDQRSLQTRKRLVARIKFGEFRKELDGSDARLIEQIKFGGTRDHFLRLVEANGTSRSARTRHGCGFVLRSGSSSSVSSIAAGNRASGPIFAFYPKNNFVSVGRKTAPNGFKNVAKSPACCR